MQKKMRKNATFFVLRAGELRAPGQQACRFKLWWVLKWKLWGIESGKLWKNGNGSVLKRKRAVRIWTYKWTLSRTKYENRTLTHNFCSNQFRKPNHHLCSTRPRKVRMQLIPTKFLIAWPHLQLRTQPKK